MNTDSLKTIVNHSIQDNILLLNGSELESIPVMNTLSDFFPENLLKLEFIDGQAGIEDLQDKEGLLLKGRGIEYPFLGAAMELSLYIKEGLTQFELQVIYDGDFILSDAFLPFKGTLLEKVQFSKNQYPKIRVSSELQNQVECAMYFDGVIDLQKTESKMAAFTGKNEISVSGPIYLKENGTRIYNFEFVAADFYNIDIGILKMQTGFKLGTNLTYNSLEKGYTIIPYIELSSEIPCNSNVSEKNKIPLSARIFNFESDIRFRGDIGEGIDVHVNDLSLLTNGVNLTELVPSDNFYLEEQQQLKGLFFDYDLKNNKLDWVGLSVEGGGSWTIILGDGKKGYSTSKLAVELGIEDPMEKKKEQILIKGEFVLSENVVMIAEAEKQGQHIKAYIKEGSKPALKDILAIFKGEAAEVPDIRVKDFSFNLSDGKYIVQGDCYDYWPLYSGDSQQNLSEVFFTVEKEADKKSQLQISGFVTVADREILLNAVDIDSGRGWIFEGNSSEGEIIQLSGAIEQMFSQAGLSFSEELPDFYIKNAALRFEEKGRSCFLSGECTQTWQISVGRSIATADNLLVSVKYDNGKLSGTITGKTEFAGSRIDIVYDLTKDIGIYGSLTNLDTGNFIYETCGGRVLELLPMPLGIESMNFGSANIVLDLKDEHIEIEGSGKDFSQSNLIVRKSNNGYDSCFVAKVAENWKFTSVSPYLGELDNMSFANILMVLSGFQQEQFTSHGINGAIVPGINFIAELKLDSAKKTSFIRDLIKLEDEYLPVNCVISDLGEAQIDGKLKSVLNIGNGIELQDSILLLNAGEKGTECSVLGGLKLKLSEDVLFSGTLSVNESSAYYKGNMQEAWVNPFKLENTEIYNPSVEINIDKTQIPDISFSGNVHIGNVFGKAALVYNHQNPSQSALNFKFDNIGTEDILGICAPSLLSTEHPLWSRIVCSSLKNADLFVATEDTEIDQIHYKKGITGKGILKTNCAEIPVNIEVDTEQQISVYAQDWAFYIKNNSIRFSGNIGEACINVLEAGVEETIAAYKMEEQAAGDAAVSIKKLYYLDAETCALKLKQGGYQAGQIAVGLTQAYELKGETVVRVFNEIGLTAGENASAIKNAYDTAAMTAAGWLKNAGYTAEQTIDGLKAAYGLNAGDGAKCLKNAGYTSGEVALNIKNAYSSSAEEISAVLRNAGYDAVTVASFVRTAYGVKPKIIASSLRSAGYTGQEAAGAIKFVYGWTAKAAAKLLKNAGYTAEQLSAGLKYYYRLNAAEAADVLRFTGYTAGQVLFGLKNVYLQSVEKSAGILKSVGYSANETADGFKNSFNATAVVTAVILKTVEYTVIEVAGALRDVYSLSLEDTTKVLRNAGYDAVLTAEGLKAAYGVPENETARSMRKAGFTSKEVALGLKKIFSSDEGITAKALSYAGYTAEQTAEALKNIYEAENPDTAVLLKYAGYTSVESAWGLKAAYAITVEQTAADLKGAGFNSEETACGIKAAYEITLNESAAVLKGIGFDGKDTSKGLKAAYDALADETATALRNAGYTAEETAFGLKLVYQETDISAASTLKVTGYGAEEISTGLKLAYNSLTARAAYCMREAGISPEQTCLGLKQAYLLKSDILLQALKEGGYSALQNASALKSVYSETSERVCTLFRGIGYSAGETGYSLRIVFGETVVAASTIMRKVGYTANQSAAGLKTAYGSGINAVAGLLKGSGYPADEVACYIKKVYSETAQNIAKALKDAGYVCKEVAKALKVAFAQSADSAAATLSITGFALSEITSALMDSYAVSRETAAGALHTAGFNSSEVLQSVKDVYGVSEQDAAVMLDKAEYFAKEISEALKMVYTVTPEKLTEIFKKSGQTVDEIAYSLKEVFVLPDSSAISVLRAAGYSEDESGRVAAIAYKLGPAEITKVLSGNGYNISQAGSYLKNVGRYSGEVTNSSLLGAGYNEQEVYGFMKENFGWYTPVEIPGIALW